MEYRVHLHYYFQSTVGACKIQQGVYFCYSTAVCSTKEQKLQVIVQTDLHHGPKMFEFELDREMPVSSIKKLIHRKIDVHPQNQHLYIQKNIQVHVYKVYTKFKPCGAIGMEEAPSEEGSDL